jgi:hypothetical protein
VRKQKYFDKLTLPKNEGEGTRDGGQLATLTSKPFPLKTNQTLKQTGD